jgi:hypothetical protein
LATGFVVSTFFAEGAFGFAATFLVVCAKSDETLNAKTNKKFNFSFILLFYLLFI